MQEASANAEALRCGDRRIYMSLQCVYHRLHWKPEEWKVSLHLQLVTLYYYII